MSFELPKLDYLKTALAPIMSEETLDLHHGKHHQTYITNLNNLIKETEMSKMSLEEIIIHSSKDKSKVGIFNNASQHWNHILFWKCMKPGGGGKMPEKLKKELKQISEAQMSLKNSLYKQVLHSSDQDGVGYQLTMVDW